MYLNLLKELNKNIDIDLATVMNAHKNLLGQLGIIMTVMDKFTINEFKQKDGIGEKIAKSDEILNTPYYSLIKNHLLKVEERQASEPYKELVNDTVEEYKDELIGGINDIYEDDKLRKINTVDD